MTTEKRFFYFLRVCHYDDGMIKMALPFVKNKALKVNAFLMS